MFIKYECTDAGSSGTTAEICPFYGIRYNHNGFAVLSTEHSHHDYLLPMSFQEYGRFSEKIAVLIDKGANILSISGSPVYRVRRGAMLPLDNADLLLYDIDSLS